MKLSEKDLRTLNLALQTAEFAWMTNEQQFPLGKELYNDMVELHTRVKEEYEKI